MFTMGIRVDAEENLKWRLNGNQIHRVDGTIGFIVKLEGLICNEDVSKAVKSVEEKHDWVSSFHHNSSGD